MKKIILMLLVAVCFKSYGQPDYTFAKSTSTYTELTSPIVVPDAWPQTFGMKLPFTFTYFSKPFDSLRIIPNSITFTKSQTDFVSMGQEDYYYGGNLYPVGSEISYLITGTSPNRIVKVQFKNLRAVTTDTGYDYHVNNQIWIYEGSNVMEFHFGPNYNDDININTFYFGFRDSDGSPYLAITGTVANPSLTQVMNVGTFKGIPSHPTDGTVYTFAPYKPSTGVSSVAKPYAFANSEDAFSFLSSRSSKLCIHDISGRELFKVNVDADNNFKYDYSNLSSGMYIVSIQSDDQIFTEKIIVR